MEMIKVCGMQEVENLKAVANLAVDCIGFIFYEKSKRNVVLTKELIQEIRRLEQSKVGVFVNKPLAEIKEIAEAIGLSHIQLHGDETPAVVAELRKSYVVIKAFKVGTGFDFSICEQFTNADFFLFDTKGKLEGGNGVQFDWEILANYRLDVPFFLSGGLKNDSLEQLDSFSHNKLVGFDLNSGFEIEPGLKSVEQLHSFIEGIKQQQVSFSPFTRNGYYGEFGGAFIPELLASNIRNLKMAYKAIIQDDEFQNEFRELLKNYVGRPTPLYFAKRLSEKYGATIYLKREDLNHTGAHKINNTIGQILLAKRMGKTRIIAETGAGQHGVATATVCALMGLECVVYMGAVDVKRQAPNVGRMKMLGATVVSAESGSKTLKDATNEAIRDWINNPDSFYIIGSVVGPDPYPEMVAYFQRVISEEIKWQLQKQENSENPDMVIACVGGGSNAAGAFYNYLNQPNVALVAVEAAGLGTNTGKSAATSVLGSVGIIHGTKTLMMQTEDGQIIEPYSISAGLDYPGIGPLHAHLINNKRVEAVSVTDAEALRAGLSLTRLEGIIPALESAHALAALDFLPVKGKLVVVNLSGRGDKDLDTYLKVLNID